MTTTNFTEIASRYERDSLIQKSAAEKLLGLLDIKRNDSVLDLGCGTGNLTRTLRTLTDGTVVGVDPSTGMIREAETARQGLSITFGVNTAEQLDYRDRFTVIFCNSVFQWFTDPGRTLGNCYAALRNNGRMGIQAPARSDYCPNFVKAIEMVAHDARTAKTFSGFRLPWLFMETASEYSSLFRKAGFTVPFAVIETIKTHHKPDQAMTIFESGAAAGYLNQQFYDTRIDEGYSNAFREIVKGSFEQQANEQGQIELVFNRIYLIAEKCM